MVSGMELLSDKKALIDKVYINGLKVINIESMEKLEKLGVEVIKVRKQKNNTTVEYDSITIGKTDLFDVFKCSTIFVDQFFVHLELSIIDDGYRNLNCTNTDGLRDRLDQIKECLYTEYGIIVDFTNAKLKKMEINKTIVLSYPFEEYQRPLTLMMSLFPRTLRLQGERDYKKNKKTKASKKRRSIKTYHDTSGKHGLTIKIYDKKEQLKVVHKIEVNHNYLRFEIVLNTGSKIRNTLGTDAVSEITDIAINNYFTDFINKNILNPYKDYSKSRDIMLKKTLKEFYLPNNHTWAQDMLLHLYDQEIDSGSIPDFLDINEIVDLLDCLKPKDRQTKSRIKNKLLTLCEGKKKLYVFFSGDNTKYKELINKLM